MLTPEKKKQLLNKLSEHKKKIAELKSKLSEINTHKETWFKKKEGFNKQISELIKHIKSNRNIRDKFTKQIKNDKVTRKKIADDVSDKISRVKKLNQEKRELLAKYNIKGDPLELKERMDKLELKVETEVLSIEQEKKVMKQIRDLKKKFKEVKSLVNVWEDINRISKEIKKLKRERDNVHNKIQTQAKQGQEKHEALIASSKEIDDLKEKEAQAFEQFLKFKKDFTEINNKLKNELGNMGKVNSKLSSDKREQRNIEERQKKEMMATKEKDVKEKIKKRKKLTTEDLLILQKSDDL